MAVLLRCEVVAIQNGQAIFNMDISFHIDEPGFQHSEPMPNVPTPQELNQTTRSLRPWTDQMLTRG